MCVCVCVCVRARARVFVHVYVRLHTHSHKSTHTQALPISSIHVLAFDAFVLRMNTALDKEDKRGKKKKTKKIERIHPLNPNKLVPGVREVFRYLGMLPSSRTVAGLLEWYTHTHTHTDTHTDTHTHIHAHVCMYACMYVCMYVSAYVRIHVFNMYMYRIHTHMCTYVYTHAHTCTYVYTHTHMYVGIHTYIHTHTHTHTHTHRETSHYVFNNKVRAERLARATIYARDREHDHRGPPRRQGSEFKGHRSGSGGSSVTSSPYKSGSLSPYKGTSSAYQGSWSPQKSRCNFSKARKARILEKSLSPNFQKAPINPQGKCASPASANASKARLLDKGKGHHQGMSPSFLKAKTHRGGAPAKARLFLPMSPRLQQILKSPLHSDFV